MFDKERKNEKLDGVHRRQESKRMQQEKKN